MSKLLIQDRPIMILPTLAIKIGLNESIILQQIHYWLLTSKHEKMEKSPHLYFQGGLLDAYV